MCRHMIGVNKEDCMNCDRDDDEFLEWWENKSGWGGELLSEGNLARSAWKAAIRYIEDELK